MELLNGPSPHPTPWKTRSPRFWMGTNGYLDDIEVEDVLRFDAVSSTTFANSTVLDTVRPADLS